MENILKESSLRFLKKQYASFLTWPMLGLSRKRTGLPIRIYISEKLDFFIIDEPHIKVQNNYSPYIKGKCFSISIAEEPKILNRKRIKIKQTDLEKIYLFIKKNKTLLLRLWNEEISQMELMQNPDFLLN